MARPTRPLTDRFAEKHEPDASGCWLWTASTRPNGYGQIGLGGGRVGYAHRVAWELAFGPIPTGWVIDHQCHNNDASCPGGETCRHRRCVRPDHLRAVPQSVNSAAGARGFTHTGRCHSGRHEITTPSDVIVWSDGRRRCRQCERDRQRTKYLALTKK